MRFFLFLGKFLVYLTILFIIMLPATINYFETGDRTLSTLTFFTFYLPMNLIPFIALVLATPVTNKLRAQYIGVGSFIIFLFTMTIIYFQFTYTSIASELFYLYSIGRAAFPFILWFVLVNKHLDFNA